MKIFICVLYSIILLLTILVLISQVTQLECMVKAKLISLVSMTLIAAGLFASGVVKTIIDIIKAIFG